MFSQSIVILDNDIVERYCDTSKVVRYLKTMSLRVEEWKKDEQWFQSMVKLYKKHNVKVLWYFHSMSTLAKDWKKYERYCPSIAKI